jgi:uncharacterized membrane protein YbhN (UPF0104 family)
VEEAPPAPTNRSRRRIVDALKAIATIVILVLVLRKVPFPDLAARLGHLGATDLLLLTALTVVQVTIGVVRWHRLLSRLGERVSFLGLYGDVLVGLTYNMFLPTTVGGDVVRAVRCRARVTKAHRAWSTSLFERIAGLLAMAASGAIAATLGASALIPTTIRLVATAITIALLAAFFGAAAPFRVLVRFFEKRLSPQTEMRGIVDDLEGPLATSGARLEALFWSLLYQAVGVVFVIVGARGLGAPGHELAIVIGVPLVHVLSMLPVTIGGLGLREGLFVAILGRLGVASDVALGLAAQWLASSVGFAIAGAVVALVSRPRAMDAPAPR